MIYQYANPFVGGFVYADSRADAEYQLRLVQEQFLTQEAGRFTVAQEISVDDGVSWVNVDLSSADEDGVYQVFNTLTGKHTKVKGRTAAIEKQREFKQAFLNDCGLLTVTEMSERPKEMAVHVPAPEAVIIGG